MAFIHLRKVLSGFVVLSALGASAQASVILDGAQLLQQNDMGAFNTPTQYGWGTQGPGSALATAHLAVGPDLETAITVPGNGDLAYTLSYGTTHFILSGDPGYVVDHLGVDLFFNETNSISDPQITAYDGGAALGDQRDWYAGNVAPGVGLTATLGSDTVTLSNYSFVNSVFPDPIYASFDLTVSSSVAGTPEPGTFLLAAGVLGLAIKLRR